MLLVYNIYVASSPGHSQILSRGRGEKLRDKIWEWPGDEANIYGRGSRKFGPRENFPLTVSGLVWFPALVPWSLCLCDMAGRVVVVFGACGNIGFAVVKLLLESCKFVRDMGSNHCAS